MRITREVRAAIDLGEDPHNEAEHVKQVVESALAQLALSFDVRVDLLEISHARAPIPIDALETETVRIIE